MTRTRVLWLVATVGVSMFAPVAVLQADPPRPPRPPTGDNPTAAIVIRACRAIEDLAADVVRGMAEIRLRASRELIAADRAGATNERLQTMGQRAIEQIGERARVGLTRLDTLRDTALDALRDAGGSEEQAARITECARRAATLIVRQRDQQATEVRELVRRLTR